MNTDGIAYVPPILVGPSKERQSGSSSRGDEFQREYREVAQSDASDDVLLMQVGNGSKAALTVLFHRYQRTVLNVAWRILRDRCEAEDLRQEVFLLLFQKAKLFDARKGSASSWIVQITHHRAIDRRRQLSFREHYNAFELKEEIAVDEQHRSPVDLITARTLLAQLREHLSAAQQQTLELHFFEGYSLREVAEKTNQTPGNVRNHYYRGLERLRSVVFPQKEVSLRSLLSTELRGS